MNLRYVCFCDDVEVDAVNFVLVYAGIVGASIVEPL